MLGGHRMAMAIEQPSVARADSGRLIDGELFGDGNVHRQMQEGIGLAEFGRVVLIKIALGLVEHAMVFWMREDGFEREAFRALKRLAGFVLGPGVEQEFTGLIPCRIKHLVI